MLRRLLLTACVLALAMMAAFRRDPAGPAVEGPLRPAEPVTPVPSTAGSAPEATACPASSEDVEADAAPVRLELETLLEESEPDAKRAVGVILERALQDLQAGRLPLCRRRLERLERIDPAYAAVHALRAALEQRQLGRSSLAESLRESWEATLPRLPLEESFHHPTRERWGVVREAISEDDGAADILSKLNSIRITMQFDGVPTEEALDYFREISGLDLRIDPLVSLSLPQGALVFLRVADVLLDGAVRLAFNPLHPGITYDILPGGEIRLTSREYR